MKNPRRTTNVNAAAFCRSWILVLKAALLPPAWTQMSLSGKKKRRKKMKQPQFQPVCNCVSGETQSCCDNVRFVLCHGWFCVKSTSNEHLNCLFSCRNLHYCVTPFQPGPNLFFFSPHRLILHFCSLESGCGRCMKYLMGCQLPHQLDSLLTFDGLYSYGTSNDCFLC